MTADHDLLAAAFWKNGEFVKNAKTNVALRE